ncbi:MAG: hypothetical protein JSV85_04510 [Candidatus Bathyarchaeota archaeon]|nr:MAG: hypothetical protein JSV85_04510 [Candidatus Bathyarchaeota archaeon]
MASRAGKLRLYIFLALLILLLILIVRLISTAWDSIVILILFTCANLLAVYHRRKHELGKVEQEFKAKLEETQTFYFVRIVERLVGRNGYYIFCAVISMLFSVANYKFSAVNLLLTDQMAIFYALTTANISLFLGFAFWKLVTEDFSKLVKAFYRQHKAKERVMLQGKETSHVTSALLFHKLVFDVKFSLMWGAFWSLLAICWIGYPSTMMQSIFDVFGTGLNFFVQSITVAISAPAILAIFQIGRSSSILVADDTAIFSKSFGEFFKNLEKAVLKVTLMQLLVPGVILPNIFFLRGLYIQYDIVIILGVFCFVLGQLGILFFAIYGAHIAMKKLKEREGKKLRKRIIEKKNLLETVNKDSFLYIGALWDYHLLLLKTEHLESTGTWPISTKGVVVFATLLAGTILNALRDYLLTLFS